MAESILKLRVDSQEYDNKLKRASQGLQQYIDGCRKVGGTLEVVEQETLDYVKAIGNMDTTTRSAKGALGEMTKAFSDLSMEYKRMTDQEKAAPIGKAMSESLDQLRDRIQQTKADLNDISSKIGGAIGGGGMGGGMLDMMSVAGGNLIAQGVTKLTSELTQSIEQSIELARAGESIKVAFDRLNQPGLLNNLKEATHGTVSELELMKAAVKFADFKLPVEELGTMLAFAQKKAKDTGQSIDYMTESIVTGLGRKSLMILDNLGLSAAEIREKMKSTGDMTKAVGEIIREQMAAAGDYVETAADRTARATAQAKDKMLELGQAAMPVAEEFDKAFNTIKIAGMQLLNLVLVPISKMINHLREFQMSPQDFFENKVLPKTMKETGSNVDDKGNYIKRPAQKGAAGFDWEKGTWKPGYYGAIYNSATGQTEFPDINVNGTHREKTTPRTTPKVNAFDASKIAFMGGEGVKADPDQYFQSVWGMIGDQGRKQIVGTGAKQFDYKKLIKEQKKEDDKSQTATETLQGIQTMVGSLQGILSGIETLGIELPKELTDIIGVLQTITGIVGSIQAMQQVGTWLGLFHNGGIARAANGFVGGNTFSGDQIPIMVNSGELILNRAQQGAIASQLEGGGMRGMQLSAVITGEQLRLVLNNNGRRTGRGEYVTTNFR